MTCTISVDHQLLSDAARVSGLPPDEETVEAALRLLIQMKAQESLRALRGQLPWEGDLEDLRNRR